MKRYILNLAVISTVFFGFTSCDDFLSEYSQDLVVAKEVSHFDELLLGSVYLQSKKIEYGPMSGSTGGFFNILDDDLSTGRGKERPGQISTAWTYVVSPMYGYYAWQFEVGRNYRGTATAEDKHTWAELYEKIGYINVMLDEMSRIDVNTDKDRDTYHRVLGEALFLRAYAYFTLANLYGDAYAPSNKDVKLNVPLKLTPYVEHNKEKETQFVRATNKEVYEQIVLDLSESIANFDKVVTPPSVKKIYRASKTAAHLLLGRVYLYMQEWDKAEYYSDLALKDKKYFIENISAFSHDKAFLTKDNSEIIFSQGSNHLSTNKVFTGDAGDFCVSSDLFLSFDAKNDKRIVFFNPNLNTDSLSLGSKYEKGSFRSRISDVFTLRYSEALLNKAEACAMQQGKESVANDALFEMRKNRILEYAREDFTGASLVDEIRLERRRELCFEGHRWFDLRRYAVNEKYPFEKEIIHDINAGNDHIDYVTTDTYVLAKGDKAYTFAIPKSVIEFDKTPMPQNEREKRKPLDKPKKEEKPNDGLDDEDEEEENP